MRRIHMGQSKRDKLTEFNRNNILNAAKELFEKKGILQTTMDDIAKKAEYSKSTIYVYFKSKDEIYNHIIFESMQMLKDRLSEAVTKNVSFKELFFSICRNLEQFQQEYPLYFDSILNEISIDEEGFKQYPVLREIYRTGEEMNEVLLNMIEKGIADGDLRPDMRPIPTIFMLWASLGGIIKMAEQKKHYFEEKLQLSKQIYLEHSYQMLFEGLKGGNEV